MDIRKVIFVVMAVLVCSSPALAHRDSTAKNLVTMAGVTVTSDGDLNGAYAASYSILNAVRTGNAEGFDGDGFVVSGGWEMWHSDNQIGDGIASLTITFPEVVTMSQISWNSGQVGGGYFSMPYWSARLDDLTLVNNKSVDSGLLELPAHLPENDPGTQHEIATFAPASGTVLELDFEANPRAGGMYAAVRDINVYAIPEPTALALLVFGALMFISQRAQRLERNR